jgi:signal transduction histidine kinase
MRAPTLRTRATVLGGLVFAVLLGVGAFLLVATLDSRLTASSDQVDRARLRELLQLAGSGDLPETLRNVHDNAMAQVVGPDGEVLATSANLAGHPAVADLPATGTPALATLEAPDEEELETYRVWYASGENGAGPVTVYVGSSLENVDEATSALRRTLWIGVPLTVAVLGLVIWLLIGRVLARLDRIRAEVDLISEASLDRRVADDGAGDEVGRLARTMNAMLGRLEASARRQRDFVADVSHDLQSPLTGQRTTLELALASPGQTDLRTLCAEMLGATSEMERLVGDLLVLASVDAGQSIEPTLFDLDELVLEEATRLRTVTEVRIETRRVSAAPAFAHPGDVRRVVRNLLENAVAHASEVVEVVVGVDAERATLDVVDDGPGIDPEDRDQVFERFYRADAARSRGAGSGLGLAIARGLAERAGGDVRVLDSVAGAHLRLTLPTSGKH